MKLEFRGEIRSRDIYLGVISIEMVLKVELNGITKKVSPAGEKVLTFRAECSRIQRRLGNCLVRTKSAVETG